MPSRSIRSLIAFGFVAFMSGLAFAQSNKLPTVDEIINKLNVAESRKDSAAKSGRKTRSVVVTDDKNPDTERSAGGGQNASAARTSQPTTQIVEKIDPVSYSESRIQFEFGSDRLTGFSKKVLDVFAAAMQSPSLKTVSFIVEGHTDGVGGDRYNLTLSRKRADAVVRYLADARGVNIDRLSARGQGKRELVNVADPAAPENRRVAWLPLR